MNVFEEFRQLVIELEKHEVRYALVGGVAMAFYAEPRFTRDIDILVDSKDYQRAKAILEKDGYFESASPWTFRNVAIELHRFLKVTPEDEMMIDILIAKDDEVKRIIEDALEADSEEGRVMVANKKDLIWLKRTRDSKQDQADIEKLEDEKIDRVIKKLSDLYEFNRKIKAYELVKKERANKPLKPTDSPRR